MIIFCAISQTVPYRDEKGETKILVLRPGKHNYPMLKPSEKDPLLCDTLRVLRKHKKISFDNLLPSDVEVLKNAPPGVDKVEYLAEKVLLKPNPKGRQVVTKGKKNAGGPGKKDQSAPAPQADSGDGKKPGKVSDKK